MRSSAQISSLNEPPTFLFLDLLLPPQGMLSFTVAPLTPVLIAPGEGVSPSPRRVLNHAFLISVSTPNCCVPSLSRRRAPCGKQPHLSLHPHPQGCGHLRRARCAPHCAERAIPTRLKRNLTKEPTEAWKSLSESPRQRVSRRGIPGWPAVAAARPGAFPSASWGRPAAARSSEEKPGGFGTAPAWLSSESSPRLKTTAAEGERGRDGKRKREEGRAEKGTTRGESSRGKLGCELGWRKGRRKQSGREEPPFLGPFGPFGPVLRAGSLSLSPCLILKKRGTGDYSREAERGPSPSLEVGRAVRRPASGEDVRPVESALRHKGLALDQCSSASHSPASHGFLPHVLSLVLTAVTSSS